MDIAIIGTGFVGGTLGRALAGAGHRVVFGSRHPDRDEVAGESGASVTSIEDALAAAQVVVLAVPGSAVRGLAASVGDRLGGKLVIDATNRMGEPVLNSRSDLPTSVRYSRAFNTMGGENMANPIFPDGTADMFSPLPRPIVPPSRRSSQESAPPRVCRRRRRGPHRLPVQALGRPCCHPGPRPTSGVPPPRGLRGRLTTSSRAGCPLRRTPGTARRAANCTPAASLWRSPRSPR